MEGVDRSNRAESSEVKHHPTHESDNSNPLWAIAQVIFDLFVNLFRPIYAYLSEPSEEQI